MRVWLLSALIVFLLASQLALADVTIDKELYKPGETVRIQLYYPSDIDNVELSIVGIENNVILSKKTMKSLGSNRWGYNYSISKKSSNGLYSIKINASEVGTVVNATDPILIFQKNFNVLAWSVDASLNKYVFSPRERLELSVIIKEKYSDDLEFKISYDIRDVFGAFASGQEFTLTGVSKGFNDFYEIPQSYALGTSKVIINITDSDKRGYLEILEFEVSNPFVAKPSLIEDTMTDEIVYKSIRLDNQRNIPLVVDSVKMSGNIANVVSIVQRPYVISPGEEAVLELKVDAGGATQDAFGSVVVTVNQVEYNIPIELMYDASSDMQKFQENINIIWYFAIGIVAAIVIITVVRYRKIKKERPRRSRRSLRRNSL